MLLGLVEALGMQTDSAPRIATGFGAGMACRSEVCGALSGAMMALGLKFGRYVASDGAAKDATYQRVEQLLSAFEVEFGSIVCREITGCDMRTPEGRARAAELNLHGNVCPKFVAFAAEQAEKIIST